MSSNVGQRPPPLKTSLSVDLLLYGVMLLSCGVLAPHLSAYGVTATQWVGFTGGGVSVLLGVLGWRGHPVRCWAIAVMTVLSLGLLAQSVMNWLAVKAGVETAKVAAVIQTLLGVFGIVQLVNLIQNKEFFPFNTDAHQDVKNEDK